jgi:hypothetical protein
MLPFRVTPQNEAWQLATDMDRLGIKSDDQIALAGHSNPVIFAARLMRVHVIAQLNWDVMFWDLSETDRRRVLAALASTGAKFAVAEVAPPDPSQAAGWQRIGSSSYYVYPLFGVAPSSNSLSESAAR